MSNEDAKNNLLQHSEAKVELLGKYLQRYLNIISNDGYTDTIHIYDLFCGPGVYENDGEGSPIVTLNEVKEVFFSRINTKAIKKPKINCYFNDLDSGKISSLKDSIDSKSLHYSSIGSIDYTSNDYLDEVKRLPQIFKKFKNEKSFVFIDPYGYKEVRAEHIKDLMDCSKKSEVLLWLPIQFMYRFSVHETPESLQNFIMELGIEKDLKDEGSVWDFIYLLKMGFQNFLGSDYFVDNFSLKKEENTVFCLYFFTSHIKGFEKMLEAKWVIDTEQGKGWDYTGNQPSLFHQMKTNPLEEALEEYLSGESRTNGEIYEFTLRKGFLPKHTNEIFRNWQQISKLDVVLANGDRARKGSFYISYDYYKTYVGASKVRLTLQ